EVHPLDLHGVLRLELLNTHGTEVAPRSDVVGEHGQRHRLAHAASLAGRRRSYALRRSLLDGADHRNHIFPPETPGEVQSVAFGGMRRLGEARHDRGQEGFQTRSGAPPFTSFNAIGSPMPPRPMKPTRVEATTVVSSTVSPA